MDPDAFRREIRAKRLRLRNFRFHLLAYGIMIPLLVIANILVTPTRLWFVFPMVAWGAPLALHCAWAMGLLDGLFGGRRGTRR